MWTISLWVASLCILKDCETKLSGDFSAKWLLMSFPRFLVQVFSEGSFCHLSRKPRVPE